MRDWWRRWMGSALPAGRSVEMPDPPTAAGMQHGYLRGPRVTGFPQSSNGASSLHLRWVFDTDIDPPIRSASVVLEVTLPPRVDRLYFWAMQVDVADPRRRHAGGAHLGLQWHPDHPGSTAVNWGGYDQDGTILHGSESALPSALHNPHTRDYRWSPATPYQLRVEPAPSADQPAREIRGSVLTAWRGSVTDLSTGERTVIRDLYAWGDRIIGVSMWSEVFARCDDPQAQVRWSAATMTDADGVIRRPKGFAVNYQSEQDGGCANTCSTMDSGYSADGSPPPEGYGGFGLLQTTNAERSTPQGTILPNL